MRTERVIYTPEVILPSKRNENNNTAIMIKHSSKNAALLTAALLAMAANAKAFVQNDNENNSRTNVVLNCETQKNDVAKPSKAKNENNVNQNDNSGALLLIMLGGGMSIATKLFD